MDSKFDGIIGADLSALNETAVLRARASSAHVQPTVVARIDWSDNRNQPLNRAWMIKVDALKISNF